jgi:hypothetical protein
MGAGLEDLKVSSKIKSSRPDPIDFPEIHRYSLFRKELRKIKMNGESYGKTGAV